MNELKRKMEEVTLETKNSMDKLRKDVQKMHEQDLSAITAEIRLVKQETQALSSHVADVLQILRSKQ